MRRLLFTVILIGVVVLAGCKKGDSSPTGATLPTTPSNPAVTNASGQPGPNVSSIPNYGGMMATIQYDYSTPAFPPSIPSYTLSFILGFAQFGSGVDAGVVRVGTDTLIKQTAGSTAYYMNNFTSGGTGLKSVDFLNGSEHNWTVSGSGSVSAMASGLYTLTPRTPFTINSPADGTTIVKANDLTITWTNTSPSPSDSILIVIVGPGGSYMKSGIAASGTSQGYTVASSDLGAMTGTCYLQMVKYRYNVVTVTVNSIIKKYVVLAEIVKQKTINLQ